MMRWTAKKDALVLELVGKGYGWDAIGKQLGCAPTAVHAQWRKIRSRQLEDGAARLHGGKKPEWTELDLEERAALHRDAYDAARPKASNDRFHLKRVIGQGGFFWWSDKALERVYALERPMRQGRQFWNAA